MSSALSDVVSQRRAKTDEELMEVQQRIQSGAMQPSAKVVRAVRGSSSIAGVASVNTTETKTTPAASTIKPTASSTPAVPSSTVRSPSVASTTGGAIGVKESAEDVAAREAVFPSANVPEKPQVAPPRPVFGQSSVSATRTGFPAAFRADLSSNNTNHAQSNPQPTAPASEGGKKKSLFAQQRDRMLQKQKESGGASAPVSTSSSVQREVVKLNTAPELAPKPAVPSTSSVPTAATPTTPAASLPPSHVSARLPEAKGISEENDLKIADMSVDEIEAEQRELERLLPPSIVAMLRAKRNAGDSSNSSASATAKPAAAASQSKPLPQVEYPAPTLLDEDLLDAGDNADNNDDDEDEEDDLVGADEDDNAVFLRLGDPKRQRKVQQRLNADKELDSYSKVLSQNISETQKMEWTEPVKPTAQVVYPTDVQGYKNDSEIWNSFRVDFQGNFIGAQTLAQAKAEKSSSSSTITTTEEDYDDPMNALYHHGDEADRPGYTMREILHLARSTVMSQRTLSLQILSRVLKRIRLDQYEYPAPVQPTPRGKLPASLLFESAAAVSAAQNEIPSFSILLFSHLLYLNLATFLRLALDDNRNTAGIHAALVCIEHIVFLPTVNLAWLEAKFQNFKGYELARNFEQFPSLASELNKDKNAGKSNSEEDEKKKYDRLRRAEQDGVDFNEDEDKKEDDVNDNAKDEDLCAKDFVVGFTRMHLLERIRFILEAFVLPAAQFRANPAPKSKGTAAATASSTNAQIQATLAPDAVGPLVMLNPCFSILLAFVQHSPQVAARLFDTPLLKENFVRTLLSLVSIVSEGRALESQSLSLASLAHSLHIGLLIVCNLSQVHRDMAFFFLAKTTLVNSIKKFIVIPNGVPGLDDSAPSSVQQSYSQVELEYLLPLSIDTLNLWRIHLSYGLDIESFMDHYGVLIGIISAATNHVEETAARVSVDDTHKSTEALECLWLRQLQAVFNVYDGLTFLFQPTATSSETLKTASSFSAPPAALSFEFTHVLQAIDQLLGILPKLFFLTFKNDAGNATNTLNNKRKLVLQQTLGSLLHLLASYYTVVPTQHGVFDIGRFAVQVEKHLLMLFCKYPQSPLMQNAIEVVKSVSEKGLEAVLYASPSHSKPMLSFANLPIVLPSDETSPVATNLNVLFGFVRWQEALYGLMTDADVTLKIILNRVLESSRHIRSVMLKYFYAHPSAASTASVVSPFLTLNRIHSKTHPLSSMESECLVSLLVLHRLDTPASVSASSFNTLLNFYAGVIQLVPTLLRNGQQYYLSKLLADVLFHANTLQTLAAHAPNAATSAFNFQTTKLLGDLVSHFAYFQEELLISTLLQTHSILTPTLCTPVSSASNMFAHFDTSTGRQWSVNLPHSVVDAPSAIPGMTSCSVAWLFNMIKQSKFLKVQLPNNSANTKAYTAMTVLQYIHFLHESLRILMPKPLISHGNPHIITAHPAASVTMRALMELFLLGSDIFSDPFFSDLLQSLLTPLLASDIIPQMQQRNEHLVGVANHSTSTLSTGTSVNVPGDATISANGTQFVGTMPNPAAVLNSDSADHAALKSMAPFYDFHSNLFPTAIWGASFYPFFKDLVELFVSDSMGDTNFALLILTFFRQEYPTDYRIVVWRELSELMQSIDLPKEKYPSLPLDRNSYLFPYETNQEILTLLYSMLGGAPPLLTKARNEKLYEIAIHHVSIALFGWSHVSGQQELDAAERVRRFQQLMPMAISPDCTKDIMNYRFRGSLSSQRA